MRTMKCEEVDSRMIDYLDNNLDEELRREIEMHIESCEKCFDEANECQKVLNSLSQDKMQSPDESLRINFYHMLHSEIKKKEEVVFPFKISQAGWNKKSMVFRIAAGIGLLLAGTIIGAIVTSGIKHTESGEELSQLKSEVDLLKRTALFTMLKEESSSYRIQAVNYADDLRNPDENVINALVETLNHDKNVNVRMAAAYALSKFGDQQSVRDSLVKSLSLQVDPIVQVTLINILVDRKEKGAIKPIQQIIGNAGTLKEVRSVAENRIKTLL